MTPAQMAKALDKVVAANLYKHRIDAGMSQRDLAQRLGVSAVMIGNYETCESRISPARLAIAAFVLRRPVSAFLPDIEPMPPERAEGRQAASVETLRP